MHAKTKGSIAELQVCADLTRRGWKILIPYGENQRYDLVAEKEGKFVRIQVKYVTPRNGVLIVNCRSSNNWSTQSYSADQIDFIATYNPENGGVYYVPVSEIRRQTMILRVAPSKNNQKAKVRYAKAYAGLPFVRDSSPVPSSSCFDAMPLVHCGS